MSEVKGVLYKLGGIFIHPRETLELLIQEQASPVLPLLLFSVLAYSLGFATIASLFNWIAGFFAPVAVIGGFVSRFAGLFLLMAALIGLLVYVVVVHATATILGGSGGFGNMLTLSAYSFLPNAIPAAFLAIGVFYSGFALAGLALGLVCGIWTLWLVTVSARTAYGTDAGEAIISTMVAPFVVAAFLTFLGTIGLAIIALVYIVLYLWLKERRKGGVEV